MTRQEIISRLCLLQKEVKDQITGYSGPADCFCGKGGFWSHSNYSDATYKNAGAELEWIEKSVRDAIAKELSARGAAI